MSQNLILKNKGLFTNSNQLSAVPEGALTIAKNVNIDKDEIIEPIRGFKRLENAPVSDTIRNDRLSSYQGKIIAHRSSDNTMAYYNSSWTNYAGTYQHPDQDYARMQFTQSNGNLYFTTSLGIKILDNYLGPIYSTGMPRGLDGSGVTSGSSGFMTNDTQVAYRIVWGSRDANNNLYLGTPSQRIVVANASGGTRDISLTVTIPDGVTSDDFFQVYRSKESASATDEPNDELQLVYEKNPSPSEITAKSVTFTDSTPVSLMGASLYTNASQEGISESNDEPPFAKDIATFKNFTFFLNVKTKQKISIKLLSAGGSGLVLDDTITIAGLTFTGKASETISSGYFKVSTGGSASQNISDTAQSLVKVINQRASNTLIYAYYVSGFQDLPGQIQIVYRTLGAAAFSVVVNRATAWDLGLALSSNDQYQNGIMWSKTSQPEHVPSAHLEFVGSKNYEGRRILALRDSLFILKSDGVWRLTGSDGKWSIDPLDTSTKIIAPDSAVVVNNQIFCLSDQGIVAISDVGVEVISRPIEDLLANIQSANYDSVKKLSFGVAYETDRKYILHTITNSGDAYCTQAYVFNTFTRAFTNRVKDVEFQFVNLADDKLYICNPSDKHILQERKSLTFTDFIDEEVDGFSILSFSDKTIFLNTVSGIDIGYLISSGSFASAVVMSIDASTNSVIVNSALTWPLGDAAVNKVIDSEFEYTAQHFDNPGVMKQFQEIALLFRQANFINGTISFYTDLSGGYTNTLFFGNYGGGLWGLFSWDSIPWGGVVRPKPIRVFIPREKSRGSLLSVKIKIANAYAMWSLNGASQQYEWVSERTTRA